MTHRRGQGWHLRQRRGCASAHLHLTLGPARMCNASPHVLLLRCQVGTFWKGCGHPSLDEWRAKCPAVVLSVLLPQPRVGTWGRWRDAPHAPIPMDSPTSARWHPHGAAGSLLGQHDIRSARLRHKEASPLHQGCKQRQSLLMGNGRQKKKKKML